MHLASEFEHLAVSDPVGMRAVVQRETVLQGGDARDVGLQEQVLIRLCDKTKNGHDRPCQYAGLASRQGTYN